MKSKPQFLPAVARVLNGKIQIEIDIAASVVPERGKWKAAPDVLGDGQAVAAPDFATVAWFGRLFTFGKKQAIVVGELWIARSEGYEWVTQDHLLREAGADSACLRDLFRNHPAWGTLIQSAMPHGGQPGTYRLANGAIEPTQAAA